MPAPETDLAARRVYLFGGVRVEDERGSLRLPAGSARDLFVYLILHPDRGHTRDKLADLIWPEAPPSRSRRQISDALYRLRQALGEGWFIAEGDTLAFDPEAVWVDVWALESRLESGHERAVQDGLQDAVLEAVELVKGDLAPEVTSDWILPRRVYVRERYLAALLQLAREAERRSQHALALAAYQRLALADPLREDAQRGLMRTLTALGRLADALDGYERFKQQMAAELDAPPTAETIALARRLRQEWEIRQTVATGAKTPPFVGRAAERAQLLTHLDQAYAGNGGVVVLLGQAGMGKTRLLEVIQESATWRGWQVFYGRSEEFALPSPYAPFSSALEAALPPPRAQQMAQLVAPHWLALIARIVPAIQAELAPDEDVDPRQAVRQMSRAIARLLAGLTEIAPHLLVLDDVQWADDAFWQLMTALQPACATLPLLIVVSGRSDALRRQPRALAAIQSWEAAGAPVISLSPLSAADLGNLATAMGRGKLTGAEAAALRTGSGGNPLFALALLEARPSPQSQDTPALSALMQRRLDKLSTPAQLALQAAAVLGFQFEYALWARLTPGLPATEMPAVAGELERQRLIELAGDGYQFAHDTLRAHVNAGIPAARRAQLHQRALAALQEQGADDVLRLLRHARGAEDDQATAALALRAGQASLHAFAYAAAIEQFSMALASLPAEAWPARYQATAGRLRAYDSLGLREQQGADSAALLDLAARIDQPRHQAEAGYFRANFLWKVGEQEQALTLAQHGLRQARDAGDTATAANLLAMLARIARNQGDFAAAGRWLLQARDLYRAVGDRFGEAQSLDRLANLLHERGEYAQAAAQHTEAAELLRTLGRARQEARALSGLALSVRAMGEYDRARTLHKQIIAISQEQGDLDSQWVEQVNLGNIAYELGDFRTATTWYVASLPIIRKLNDPYALALVLYNLGEAQRELGDMDQAREHYGEALALCTERGFQRGRGNVLHGLGLAFLAEGNYPRAEELLTQAQQVWQALNQPVKLMETNAALALTRLEAGNLAQAVQDIDAALADLGEQHQATQRWRWVHYIAFRVRQASERPEQANHHLLQAAQAVAALAAGMPKEARQRFKQRVPINQQILLALQAQAHTIQAQLVRADVPLGRELSAEDYVAVSWTLSSPLDQTIPKRTERRRHVLKRLLAEAEAQAAIPSDQDLAAALAVSTRTIERDLAALRAAGHPIRTRRRRPGDA